MFVLPQTDELRAFGGVPCNAPLLDLVNATDLPVRLEARLGGESEAWHCLVPCVAGGTSWPGSRNCGPPSSSPATICPSIGHLR